MQSVSDYIIKYLEDLNVKNIFCVTGGNIMFLTEALRKSEKIKTIFPLHEQSASIMSDAYAQYTGEIGVSLVTSGPGATNTITGIASSWLDSIPTLTITGQVKTNDLNTENYSGTRQIGMQEVDIVSMVKGITKYAVIIKNPEDIKYHLDKAIQMSTTGRKGPVLLDIPLDIQNAMVDEEKLEGFKLYSSVSLQFSDKYIELIKMYNKSKKPVLLIGNGIRKTHGIKNINDLINLLKIPVLTTWKAMDIIGHDNPYYIGRPGLIATRGANYTLQNADLVISIGARLDKGQIAYDYKNFAPKAKLVVVDICKGEISKIYRNLELSFNLDAHSFINVLKGSLKHIEEKKRSWLNKCIEWKNKYPIPMGKSNKETVINPYKFIAVLSNLLTEEDVIIPSSSGSASEITQQAFKVKKGQRVFCSPNLGGMGFGLPQAIGACISSGLKRTISIIGDGCLQHNIQELELIKRYNLPIKLFVWNNQGYNSIVTTQQKFFDGNLIGCNKESEVTFPHIKKIAYAYDITWIKINDTLNLEKEIEDALNYEGSIIVEVMIDPDIMTLPKVQSQLVNGKMVSGKLENMFPYLD